MGFISDKTMTDIPSETSLHSGNKVGLFNKDYISEFVYGGIDGAITTFAVVAGAAGAEAGVYWVLIFGFANLIADGFSMSVGNFFSVKAEHDNFEKHKKIEYWEVAHLPEKEKEEIRDIYKRKGFKGELLEQVVEVITANEEVWVDTMMKEELEMIKDNKSPFKTALATFLSFNAIGFIPLVSYVMSALFDYQGHLFAISCVATALALLLVGYLKSEVTSTSHWKGMLETLLLGGLAALLAYLAGDVLGRYFL